MTKKLTGLVLALLLVPALASAGSINILNVFGDSLSDEGNAFLMTGGLFPPPPYVQRASNGPVAAEYLAAALGVPLAPSVAGGTNYAVVGALTGTANFSAVAYGLPVLSNTGILSQVGAYLATGPVIDPKDELFLVWGGANDFFVSPSPVTAVNAVTNIVTAINLLYGAGARQFLVPNLPDLSLTPSGRSQTPANQASLQGLSVFFNMTLNNALLALTLPGSDIVQFDTFGLLHAISANPAAFGFTNVSDACFQGGLGLPGTVCATPGTYLFWDSVHPTTAGHALLGAAFANEVREQIPEPTALMLLGLGIAARLAARNRP
jgi:outer membrane lipase/esterase